MFVFKDKTIKEMRDEIMIFVGKEVENQCGKMVFIGEVEKAKVHYFEFMTGNVSFTKKGEFDWDNPKNIGYEKMWGFYVDTYKCSENGNTAHIKQLITVPFKNRNDKNWVEINGTDSILAKL